MGDKQQIERLREFFPEDEGFRISETGLVSGKLLTREELDTAESAQVLFWTPGFQGAELYGLFTADQLRALADWMDAHSPKGEQ